jgi:hypothetical protein
MVTAFEDFTLYYALSIAANDANSATLKISNTDGIELVYCIPNEFMKRVTDTSNALALDKTEPDTGTGRSIVELQITQERGTTPTTNLLKLLQQMFYIKSSDTEFRRGRFGLLNTDNPDLDAKPIKLGGYKFMGFKQVPNKDTPSLMIYNISLSFVGDHTILGGFQ